VNSKRYKPHTRAARGTHKKAKVNKTLGRNADNASPVTSFGSPVLRHLKILEKGFAPGELWSRMTAHMFKAKSMKVEDLLESIRGIEVNERYAFAKLFPALPGFTFCFKKNKLFIEMELLSHPQFPRQIKASDYLCEVSVLFLDGKGGCVKEVMETEWISFDEDLGVYEMEFLVARGAKYFLVVEGVKAGRKVESFGGRGYRVCGWGKV
jgi:hypothetical protein